MTFDLEAMALAIPPGRHPNRVPFRGVLTLVETPSDRAPSGARGHRVILTREAAERALPSLLGMALDYTPALDSHDFRRKVGIITEAEVVEASSVVSRQSSATSGRPLALVISGYLFGRDFPELIRELRTNAGALGMSYEITGAQVRDIRAPVWTLTDVTFTGAAILRREKAAYQQTSIELVSEFSELSSRGSRESASGESRDPYGQQLRAG